MKRWLWAIIVLVLVLVSCACGGEGGNAVTTDPTPETEPPRTYTIEERKEILLDTELALPADFYDPAAKDAYFEQLAVIRGEYKEPGSVPDEEFTKFLKCKDELLIATTAGFPTIIIDANGVNKNTYVDGTVTVIDGNSVTERSMTITIRGNSTADAPKKPYNIKFEEAVSLFGMEEGKKWSLLANAYDKTLLRNRMALDFGAAIGLRYTSQCEYVEVWFNGKYQGNYLLCEPISDGKNRVGIDTEGHEFILEITPFGGWSFETGMGVKLFYESPKAPTDEQKEWLNRFFDEAEKALKTHKLEEYSQYIDVQSFVDLYILMELFKDVDGYWKSLYVYVEDNKLRAGPPWDFDLTCGNVSLTRKEENYYNYHNTNGHGDKSGDSTHGFRMNYDWFAELLEDNQYAAAVKERYRELQPLITALYEGEDNVIDTLIETYGISFEREYRAGTPGNHGAGWDVYKNYSIYAGESKGDYTANVEFLRTWLRERNAWLLEHIGEK